ncbi:MAG: glycerol-3-phosphate 1-O-acyltransferase PlsY [Leptospiraceae bacterium]|nr:glycerol-3-phosphate 1-O-acyltransferase PlsY [Leptospiraceae bacterium]
MHWVLPAVSGLGYLFGSFPTAYIVARFHKIDIRKEGSGNVGATNTMRILGAKWGVLVLVIDALKGFLPVFAVFHIKKYYSLELPFNARELAMLAGVAAMLGHIYPVWLRFQGGKGVATGLGMMLALAPEIVAPALVIFLLTVSISKFVSLGSLFASASLPFFFFLFFEYSTETVLFWFLVLVVLFVWIKHRSNLKRLLDGNEHKIGERKYETKTNH